MLNRLSNKSKLEGWYRSTGILKQYWAPMENSSPTKTLLNLVKIAKLGRDFFIFIMGLKSLTFKNDCVRIQYCTFQEVKIWVVEERIMIEM